MAAMNGRACLVLAAAAGAVFLALHVRSQSGAAARVDYRPGGWFPPGFPLHGSVKLLSSPVVEMGQRVRVRAEYTVGDMAVEPGMAIEVWKHFTSDVEEFQVEDDRAPAWFGAGFQAAGVAGVTKTYTNWTTRNDVSVFPYRKTAAVTIGQGGLRQGDRVEFDLGGPQGVRMQHYEENLFNFRFVITRDEKVLGYAGDAVMKVTGGPLRKLRVQAPSVVKTGEAFPVEIVAVDEWGSLANNHRGWTLRIRPGEVTGGLIRFDEELQHYIARDVKAAGEGVLRIGVETADGRFRAVSNPVWVERDPLHGVYYGELHQHSYLHDGRGVFDELYQYGRRVGLLDFGAVTPHHVPMSVTGPQFYLDRRYPNESWPELQKITRRYNGWQGFVSILGYEYSVATNAGGHHNIFFNADESASTMQLDPAEPAAPIARMLRTLRLARVPTLVIPHIGGGPPDWSHPTDPRIERLFEIASVHGVFEESWQKHLQSGLRMGAIAAGDTHTTSMGTAYPGLNYVMTNALAGVYSTARTRAEIWRGLYERRTFATTGNTRILVDFRVNDEPMGGEIPSAHAGEARLTARISGTAPLVAVELLKNSKVIHALRPARNRGTLLRVVWGDNIYQRRAAVGLRPGQLSSEGGRLRLRQAVDLDQAFEGVHQKEDSIIWKTAAVSGDRDGFLVDIAEVTGEALVFLLDDSDTAGLFQVRIPLADLRRDGYFAWSRPADARVDHPYMKRMGVAPAFFLECELVNPQGPLDAAIDYVDREPPKAGDYFYVRMEQLDTHKAWSSPVWVN